MAESAARDKEQLPICQISQDRHCRASATLFWKERIKFLGEIKSILRRTRTHASAWSGPHGRRSAGIFEFGLTATKPDAELLPVADSDQPRIILRARVRPSANNSSSITVTLTPLGVPWE